MALQPLDFSLGRYKLPVCL